MDLRRTRGDCYGRTVSTGADTAPLAPEPDDARPSLTVAVVAGPDAGADMGHLERCLRDLADDEAQPCSVEIGAIPGADLVVGVHAVRHDGLARLVSLAQAARRNAAGPTVVSFIRLRQRESLKLGEALDASITWDTSRQLRAAGGRVVVLDVDDDAASLMADALADACALLLDKKAEREDTLPAADAPPESEPESHAPAGSEPGTEPESGAETEPEQQPGPERESATETVEPEPSVEAEPESSVEAEPEGRKKRSLGRRFGRRRKGATERPDEPSTKAPPARLPPERVEPVSVRHDEPEPIEAPPPPPPPVPPPAVEPVEAIVPVEEVVEPVEAIEPTEEVREPVEEAPPPVEAIEVEEGDWSLEIDLVALMNDDVAEERPAQGEAPDDGLVEVDTSQGGVTADVAHAALEVARLEPVIDSFGGAMELVADEAGATRRISMLDMLVSEMEELASGLLVDLGQADAAVTAVAGQDAPDVAAAVARVTRASQRLAQLTARAGEAMADERFAEHGLLLQRLDGLIARSDFAVELVATWAPAVDPGDSA